MSKPHSHSEPNMEDILASIRKMISDEPSAQRPMPDQTMRSPFADDRSETPAPDAWAAQPAAPVDPLTSPSFSSLSEALKSSAPAGETRSFEERIAGLIEDDDEPAPARAPSQPAPSKPVSAPDTLSAFGGRNDATPRARPDFPAPPKPSASPGPNGADTLRARPAPPPSSSTGGPAAGSLGSKLSELGSTIPQRDDTLVPPKPDAETNGYSAPGTDKAPLPFGAKADPDRVISLPRAPNAPGRDLNGTGRGPEAKNGAGSNGASANGSLLNGSSLNGGASVNGTASSPFASRPVSEGLSQATRSLQERLKENKPAEALKGDARPASDKIDADKTDTDRADAARDDKPTLSARLAQESPFDTDAAKGAPTSESKSASFDAPRPDAGALDAKALSEPPTPDATAGGSEDKDAAPAKPGPSEALLDAVVDMVQKDPSSLSVFTSGSAFITGVGDKPHDPIPQELVPVPGQKMEGAAAELLRPMLRQWLAENMPRIVEEALRSELTSSGSSEKDPKKS